MSATPNEATFRGNRCCVRHPGHAARCWLPLNHEGRHLILVPGVIPEIQQVQRIVVARPNDPPDYVVLVATYEPVGVLGRCAEYAAAGGDVTTARGLMGFVEWNAKNKQPLPRADA